MATNSMNMQAFIGNQKALNFLKNHRSTTFHVCYNFQWVVLLFSCYYNYHRAEINNLLAKKTLNFWCITKFKFEKKNTLEVQENRLDLLKKKSRNFGNLL
jgi:hypothetical protein